MATPEINEIVTMWQMTPIGVRLNLKNLILISCGVTELLRKVSGGGGSDRVNRSYSIFFLT